MTNREKIEQVLGIRFESDFYDDKQIVCDGYCDTCAAGREHRDKDGRITDWECMSLRETFFDSEYRPEFSKEPKKPKKRKKEVPDDANTTLIALEFVRKEVEKIIFHIDENDPVDVSNKINEMSIAIDNCIEAEKVRSGLVDL